ncbi:MAG: hypothetical protein ACI8QC_003306 [Planctomycetota bacterium]|jgi:hypothetical protein
MRRSPLPLPVRRPERRVAWSAACLVFALSLLGFAGEPWGAAAEARWRTTQSLASLSMTIDVPMAEPQEGERLAIRKGTRKGTSYAAAPLGAAIMAVPAEWVAHFSGLGLQLDPLQRVRLSRAVHAMLGSVWLAGIAALLVLAARRLGVERITAWSSALAFALTTWAVPAARGFGPELPAALLLLFGFQLLLRARYCLGHLLPVSRFELVLAGATLAFAGCVHPLAWPTAFIVLGAGEVELRKGPRTRTNEGAVRGAWVLAPFAAVFALTLTLNLWRFGQPLDFGGGGPSIASEPQAVLNAALALLISPGRGMLLFAPGVVLAIVGVQASRARGERSWGRVAAASLVVTWMLAAAQWSSDRIGPEQASSAWEYGPAYMLLVLPLVWLGVPLGVRRLREARMLRLAVLVLGCSGLFVNLAGVLVDAQTVRGLARQVVPAQANEDWNPTLASPIAHWRMIRRTTAGLSGPIASDSLFGPQVRGQVESVNPRSRGFNGLGWVDLEKRAGLGWLGMSLATVLGVLGASLAILGLGPRAH